jgi:hypothetical protein
MKKHEFIRQSKVILVSFLGMKTPIHYNTGIGVLGCQMCRTTGLLFIFFADSPCNIDWMCYNKNCETKRPLSSAGRATDS